MLGAVGLVGGGGMGLDIKGIAVIGNIAFLGLGLPTLAFVSSRLQERPALRQRRGSILDPLFQFFSTVKELWRTNTALLQYLCGVACTDCSISGLVFLLPIYAMQQLNVANPAYFSQVLSFFPNLWFGYCVSAEVGGESNSRRAGVGALVAFSIAGMCLCGLFFDDERGKVKAQETAKLRFRGKGGRERKVDGAKVAPLT